MESHLLSPKGGDARTLAALEGLTAPSPPFGSSGAHTGAHTPVALASQVGGHAGILSSDDGALVIKPCLPLEEAFYDALSDAEKVGPFDALRPWVPVYYGTLRLEGKAPELQPGDGQGFPSNIEHIPGVSGTDSYSPRYVFICVC